MKLWSLLTMPSPAQQERWQHVKAKGKKRFILRTGVICWGGFMFAVMTALDLFRKPPFPRHVIDYVFVITLNLLIWPFAGYLFGRAMWSFYENHFSQGGNEQTTDR